MSAQAYNAGVVAGGAAATAANPPGTLYGTLPTGCTNGLWFVPAYGANGVYYRVTAAP